MQIAVTGSIATDYLMTYPGRFSESLVAEQIAEVSLSFLVDDLDVRRGGIAPNICFGLAQLGLRPLLIGAVGEDFTTDYQAWLERNGVDCRGVHVSETLHTARFHCMTDLDHNQIASFYTGAMAEARDIELAPLVKLVGAIDLVCISPDDPTAMGRHTKAARTLGIPFVADPSQQLARISDRDEVRNLIDGAAYLVVNSYERGLLESKAEWTSEEVMSRVGIRLTTLGKNGVRIEDGKGLDVTVPVPAEEARVDPTGVGDGFRAGFLTGLSWGLGLEESAQVGQMIATMVLETKGTQEYTVSPSRFTARLAAAYGQDLADKVGKLLV